MSRTMEFIGRKQLKKLTKANCITFTQSKVCIISERDIDFQWLKIKTGGKIKLFQFIDIANSIDTCIAYIKIEKIENQHESKIEQNNALNFKRTLLQN